MSAIAPTSPRPVARQYSESPSAGPAHRQIAPRDLYWCVLEPSVAQRERGSLAAAQARRRLSYAFEEMIPTPVEDLALAFARAGDRIVGCGIDRDSLQRVVDVATRTLTPDGLPDWLGEQLGDALATVDPRRLNLLVGQDEPRSVRHARRRVVFVAFACLLAVLALFAVGIERRVRTLAAARADAQNRAATAFALAYPEPGRQPPAVRLASELRTLERLTGSSPTRHTPGQGRRPNPSATEPFDAAATLGGLLSRTPDTALRVDTIEVGSARLTLVASVPSVEDAQRLGAAWDMAPTPEFPWRLRQPQITAERATNAQTSFRVWLTLDRAQPEEPLP